MKKAEEINKLRQALFSLKWDWLRTGFFWGFLILFLGLLPGMVNLADLADRRMEGRIPTNGDDHDYQRLAVNLLHGFGFTETILLPLETYHLDLRTPFGKYLKAKYGEGAHLDQPYFDFPWVPGLPIMLTSTYVDFYRPPGLPLLLASTYAIFGNQPLFARRLFVMLAWLTAILLLLSGTSLAGWMGSIAGGLSGLCFLKFAPALEAFHMGLIYTEIPATFWVALFCFLFIIYLKKRNLAYSCLAGLGLAGAVFTRANLLGALPFILVYLYLKGHRVKELLIFGLIVMLPVVGWSVYASIKLNRLIFFSTQGGIAFQQCNNIDVLKTGVWEPGMEFDPQGLLINVRNSPKAGENGWVNGLIFWAHNTSSLPRLFYVKLRKGFWYTPPNSYFPLGPWRKNFPHHVYLMGVGFLLLSLGLRQPQKLPRWLKNWSSGETLRLQLALVGALLLFGNKIPFWQVLAAWAAIASIAWLHPYGDYYQLPFSPPTWFLALIASHAVTTLVFFGARYHWPLDSMLMFLGFLGLGLSLRETWTRNLA